jgi:hypothetical protein
MQTNVKTMNFSEKNCNKLTRFSRKPKKKKMGQNLFSSARINFHS